MLTVFDRLRAKLEQPAHSFTPTTQTFPDLDIHRLMRDMRLAERGAEDGAADLPPTDGNGLTRPELEVIEIVTAAQKNNADELENHLAGYRQRLIELDFEERFAQISAAAASNLSDLSAELEIGLDELHPLRRHLREHEVHREKFKRKHRLDRPAKVSGAVGHAIKVMVLLLLVGVELLVNGSYLAKNSDMGVVGGVVEALSFAALNVLAAFLLGLFGVRGLVHRNVLLKLWGLVALAAYLLLAVTINLGLAHYREVAGTIFEGAGIEVMNRLLTQPFQLAEFNSWMLFGIGFGFSVIALIDGVVFTDPYFGYAAVEKRLAKVQDRYSGRRAELIEGLQDIRQDYEDVLTEARSDLGKRRTEHNAIVDSRLRLYRLFRQSEAQLENAGNTLLQAYRDANRKARSTPPPRDFATGYKLQRIKASPPTEGEQKLEDLDAKIAVAHADLGRLLVRLNEQFDAALERYKKLDLLGQEA